MSITIYKITNKINNLVYIGQTKLSLLKRWNSHCNKRSTCTKLKYAIEKYGRHNFTIDPLFISEDQNIIDLKEKEFIAKFDSISKGYNILPGGRGYIKFKSKVGKPSHFKGKKHTEESKEKMKGIHKGKHRSPSTQFKKGNVPWSKGKKVNHCALRKPVVDIYSGFIWQSIKEAAEAYGIKTTALAHLLRKNKVFNLKYMHQAIGGM